MPISTRIVLSRSAAETRQGICYIRRPSVASSARSQSSNSLQLALHYYLLRKPRVQKDTRKAINMTSTSMKVWLATSQPLDIFLVKTSISGSRRRSAALLHSIEQSLTQFEQSAPSLADPSSFDQAVTGDMNLENVQNHVGKLVLSAENVRSRPCSHDRRSLLMMCRWSSTYCR